MYNPFSLGNVKGKEGFWKGEGGEVRWDQKGVKEWSTINEQAVCFQKSSRR